MTIKIEYCGRTRLVQSTFKRGCCAVTPWFSHNGRKDGTFVVTHVPTGYRLGLGGLTKRQANELVRRVANDRRLAKLEGLTPLSHHNKLRARIQKVFERHRMNVIAEIAA